jgi:peptidase A4-like protein
MLRRWCLLLAMLAVTLGTAFTAGTASAATGELAGHAGLGGGWPWPPPGTGSWVPGGPINLAGRTFSQTNGQAQSTNWSGYAATTGTYTSVSASWTQPKGTCTNGDQYAAFWVGLDGYSSSTVEQTGTEVDCVGRTAEYYAWWEMYPGASVNLSSTKYPVHALDVFNASVKYVSGSEFTLTLTDTSASPNWTATENESLSRGTAARSSAEVIAEAPCCTFLGGILPLTNFGTMTFANAMVTPTSGSSEAIGSAPGITEITMVDNFGRDKDTVSPLTSGEAFSCTWKAST